MSKRSPWWSGISIAVRSGIVHRPSASCRNPSVIASNNSAASKTRRMSSRDNINMSWFFLSFALLNTFFGETWEGFKLPDWYQIDTLQRIDNEVAHQAELIIGGYSGTLLGCILKNSLEIGG